MHTKFMGVLVEMLTGMVGERCVTPNTAKVKRNNRSYLELYERSKLQEHVYKIHFAK